MVENMPLPGRTMNQNIQGNPPLARNGTGSKTSKINTLSASAMLARNSRAPEQKSRMPEECRGWERRRSESFVLEGAASAFCCP